MNMHCSTSFMPNSTMMFLPPQADLPISTSAVPQRHLDSKNIDIASIKGRFAWEKMPDSDIYLPVIFRGDAKYFCLKILQKVLRDIPEDVYHRWAQYQYKTPIELNHVTSHEVNLLNRINVHHARSLYTKEGFRLEDEIIRVSNFYPYYQYLRQFFKSGSVSVPTNNCSSRPAWNHATRTSQNIPSTNNNIRSINPKAPVEITKKPHAVRNTSIIPSASVIDPSRSTNVVNSSTVQLAQTQTGISNPIKITKISPAIIAKPLNTTSNKALVQPVPPRKNISETTNSESRITALPENPRPQENNSTSISKPSSASVTNQLHRQLSTTQTIPPPVKQSVTTTQTKQSRPIDEFANVPVLSLSVLSSAPSSSSTSTQNTHDISRQDSIPSALNANHQTTNKSLSSIHCGWIQINKLYTPYISALNASHHQYKIPVGLLTYYDLLKIPSADTNNFQEINGTTKVFEQIPVTQSEIDLINDQCRKHNLRQFTSETKLVTLETFYQYCTPSIIFVKELSVTEPKASICKEWLSIVQMNGGICRLRNMTTLHEQTVPFIGNSLLKNFVLSTSSLSTASLVKPTAGELEFLQLILFYSNLSINLRNAQLIDIESVKKEYSVDLILLFNDKFALNVLNYQEKGNRPNTSQNSLRTQNSTATSNTIAESTPPPSPPSPSPTSTSQTAPLVSVKTTTSPDPKSLQPTIQIQKSEATCQLPLTNSSTMNRYQKTIEFHGHRLTAFVCSGIGSNAQRECISVRSLCNIIAPDNPNIDKLEMKMLRLLRSKNVNRFRPQNQQSMGFTRLIDVQDALTHWSFLEEEIRSCISKQTETSSISTETSKSSDPDSLVNLVEPVIESTVEKVKVDKRPLDEALEYEDVPVLERLKKRIRVDETENDQAVINKSELSSNVKTNNQSDSTIDTNSTIVLTKRKGPRDRPKRQAIASWVKKYAIDDCCIRLDPCQIEANIDEE